MKTVVVHDPEGRQVLLVIDQIAAAYETPESTDISPQTVIMIKGLGNLIIAESMAVVQNWFSREH